MGKIHTSYGVREKEREREERNIQLHPRISHLYDSKIESQPQVRDRDQLRLHNTRKHYTWLINPNH